MIYLLDTNACIHYLNREDSPVRCRMEQLRPRDVLICSIVKAELYYGVFRSKHRTGNMEKLDAFFSILQSLTFDDAAALVYGQIRSDLAAKGTPIGPNDLAIASIAVSQKATLVTNNTGEFSRVTGLQLEDWQTEG